MFLNIAVRPVYYISRRRVSVLCPSSSSHAELQFADDDARHDQGPAQQGKSRKALARDAADDAGPYRLAGIDDGGARGRNGFLCPIHRELDQRACQSHRRRDADKQPGEWRDRLARNGHAQQRKQRGEGQLDNGHAAAVHAACESADENDLDGDRQGADEGQEFSFAKFQRAGVRAGQQYQADEGQRDADPAHEAGRALQYAPLEQGHHGDVHGGDERGFAAADGLQAVGLQSIAEEDAYADGSACPKFAQCQSAQDLERKQGRQQGGRGKTQRDKEQRAAGGQGDLDCEKGAAPNHGDGDQGKLLAAQGRKTRAFLLRVGHEADRECDWEATTARIVTGRRGGFD